VNTYIESSNGELQGKSLAEKYSTYCERRKVERRRPTDTVPRPFVGGLGATRRSRLSPVGSFPLYRIDPKRAGADHIRKFKEPGIPRFSLNVLRLTSKTVKAFRHDY
jgi:hypothetical protein